MLTELEKRIIASIQEDIAVTQRPYLDISKKLGITEETLLENLQSLCQRGFIRRFGATLRHQLLPELPSASSKRRQRLSVPVSDEYNSQIAGRPQLRGSVQQR